jgi:hypothetical protein
MSGNLTDAEIVNVVFNETRSLSGTNIAQARTHIAHAIMNAVASPHRIPQMASTRAHPPQAERAIYNQCAAAVQIARLEHARGVDPTNGATHFNFRNGTSGAAFQGHALRTSTGPLNNSYPTADLGASNVYANTYE